VLLLFDFYLHMCMRAHTLYVQTVPEYHIFGLYLAGSGQRGPNAGVLLRLSTDNEEVCELYTTMLLIYYYT
jgi:hypothetical protein